MDSADVAARAWEHAREGSGARRFLEELASLGATLPVIQDALSGDMLHSTVLEDEVTRKVAARAGRIRRGLDELAVRLKAFELLLDVEEAWPDPRRTWPREPRGH